MTDEQKDQQQILERIHRLEVKCYELFKDLGSLRLDLQDRWKVLPAGYQLPTGCTCGADMVPGRAYKEAHSATCPRSK